MLGWFRASSSSRPGGGRAREKASRRRFHSRARRIVAARWNCYKPPMHHACAPLSILSRVALCAAGPFARTTMEFAAVPDHVRLPGRFFGRFTTAASAQLRG
ncbi:hypothetical protein [Xanthobacter versatilis]|uniref:hypothetical protein n=1 Tax=Xanthobacter autotrophicus (strain ATCC BAA-1158 / Py2) TaxID=78245 RepID=UPI003728273D